MKYHYKCTISYDGSSFDGWQKQGNTHNTIQEYLEAALSNLLTNAIAIRGAGRTDAGVHAIGQVFDFFTDTQLDAPTFIEAINQKLPETMRILNLEAVLPDFHARKSALAKTYEYRIDTRLVANVFTRKYCYWLSTPLDTNAMKAAAAYLLGTHDFSSFTSDKTPDKDHIRTITDIKITTTDTTLTIAFTGDGFLYNMVRILAGTLIEVGQGKLNPDQIPAILAAKNRQTAGFTAPAQGLFLKEIFY